MLILLLIVMAVTALIGGQLAVRGRRALSQTLGFTAGLLLGLVAFEIIPEVFESIEQNGLNIIWPMLAFVGGFLLFHVLENTILMHHDTHHQYGEHRHPHVGLASALALAGHSLLDGVGIGLAFQVNQLVGISVALAIIAHRFADGINTVNLMLFHGNDVRRTRQMLFLVAVAPILGAASTLLFNLPSSVLTIYLGFFAGFLLYIAASDILPQAHSRISSARNIAMTVAGAVAMLVISLLLE